MDALTNFELEAQRRRETIVSDRDQAWAWAQTSSTDRIETRTVEPRAAHRSLAPQPDCQPSQLARNVVG
jgi:hypothetical protein